ncbi:MAG: type III pantothenate kinase [Pyrinomonadaceae bacterium]
MLLAIDIGNSSTKFGIFNGEHLYLKFSIPTKRGLTVDDISQAIGSRLDSLISSIIISSVVSEFESPLLQFLKIKTGTNPVFVNNSFDFGLKINYQPVSGAGTDRLIAALAAVEKYGAPLIVCDFGTATTIDAINSKHEYLGGIIAPGMGTMAEALNLKTSKLPLVEIAKPAKVIGNSTLGCIQSGIFFGYIGLVDGILIRMERELNEPAKIVATGGFAKLISENCELIEIVDESLMLEGLCLLHTFRMQNVK